MPTHMRLYVSWGVWASHGVNEHSISQARAPTCGTLGASLRNSRCTSHLALASALMGQTSCLVRRHASRGPTFTRCRVALSSDLYSSELRDRKSTRLNSSH